MKRHTIKINANGLNYGEIKTRINDYGVYNFIPCSKREEKTR